MIRWQAFGVPVSLDAWFLVIPVFVYAWAGGGRAGGIGALATIVFGLVHELGHALAARRLGYPVVIRFDGLRGWADPADEQPVRRRPRAAVILAGPLLALVVAVGLLLVIHREMQHRLGTADTAGALLVLDTWTGVAAAGLSLGLLNLMPLWPLDGGHLVTLLRPRTPHGTRRAMATFTQYACLALVLLNLVARTRAGGVLAGEERRAVAASQGVLEASFFAALWQQVRGMPGEVLLAAWFLLLFCGLASWRTLQDEPAPARPSSWPGVPPRPPGRPERRREERTANDRADFCERAGWAGGSAGAFPTGWGPSPWLRAEQALRAGDRDGALAALATLTDPGGPRWITPDLDRAELARLVRLLPEPLPLGAQMRSRQLLAVLARHGEPARIVDYAGRLYERTHDAEALYLAAEGLARHGRGDDAMAWLRRALLDRPDAGRLARDRGLAPLHDRLDFQQLVASMRAGRT